jgi:GNAT superfamily N-acetyltransferase
MENVVTHYDYRNRGYASKMIQYAADIAKRENCYKIMLMTGSKKESTLNFYKNNGFSDKEKTAFLMRL